MESLDDLTIDRVLAEGDGALALVSAPTSSDGAFALLYERHRPTALDRARKALGARHRSLAEDVVEIAFASVFRALRNGGGPRDHFDRYLHTAVKHEAWRQQRSHDREVLLEEDDLHRHLARGSRHDGPAAAMDGTAPQIALTEPAQLDPELLLGDAYRSLNPRFRAVLWMVEVEGVDTPELADALGLGLNAAAALVYRARRALRASYFETYAANLAAPGCVGGVARLTAFAEAKQPTEGFDDVTEHVAGCAACRDVLRGSARGASALAAMAPFGALSAGRWLDPDVAIDAAAPPDRKRWRWSAAAAVLLLLIGTAGAATLRLTADHQEFPEPTFPDEPHVPWRGAPAEPRPTSPDASVPPAGVTTPPPAGPAPAPFPTVLPEGATTGSITVVLLIDPDGAGTAAAKGAGGVPVEVRPSAGGSVVQAIVDIDGNARFDRLTPGRYQLVANVPIGVVPQGSTATPPPGEQRHTVDLGSVDVIAGRVLSRPALLVPWRHLILTGGTPTAEIIGAGEPARWSYDLASTPAPTSSTVIELTTSHPGGAQPAIEALLHRSDGGTAAVTCTPTAQSATTTTVRCSLGRLEGTPQLLEVAVHLDGVAAGEVRQRAYLTSSGYAHAAWLDAGRVTYTG